MLLVSLIVRDNSIQVAERSHACLVFGKQTDSIMPPVFIISSPRCHNRELKAKVAVCIYRKFAGGSVKAIFVIYCIPYFQQAAPRRKYYITRYSHFLHAVVWRPDIGRPKGRNNYLWRLIARIASGHNNLKNHAGGGIREFMCSHCL